MVGGQTDGGSFLFIHRVFARPDLPLHLAKPSVLPRPPPCPQEVYSREENRGAFDCVVTCFFIDTAHNIIEYLEIMNHCLKPGGHWVNMGPLLYHW